METAPLAIARTSAPTVSWRAGTSGILLTRTARRLRLPVSTGAVLFAGISDPQAAAVRSAVLAAGLDPEQVLVYEPPRPAAPPLALSMAAVGLALLTLLISLTVAQGQATVLRGYLGTLIAIGIPTGWARQVLMIEHAVVVSVGTALASVVAIPPVLVAVWRLPGFVLSVPWLQLVAVVGTVYLAGLLALLAASRRLRPR